MAATTEQAVPIEKQSAEAKVSALSSIAKKYAEHASKERDRMRESYKFFSGLYNGQWSETAVMTLNAEGRPVVTQNFIQNKVLTMAGSLLKNPNDIKYEPEFGGSAEDTELLNRLITYDRERGRWRFGKGEFLLDYLTHMGILEMFVDYSHDPLGNIGLRRRDPFEFFFSPLWKSTDINDNPRIVIKTWMDAEQIMRKYGYTVNRKEELEQAYKQLRALLTSDADYTEEIDKLADRSPEFYDALANKYAVIEVLELRHETIDRLVERRTGAWLPPMSPEVADAMLRLRGQELMKVPTETKRLYVTTLCPALAKNVLLEDGLHPVQIGRYPFFVGSPICINGERQAVVDVLKDPQAAFNKREATMLYWQMTAANGATFVESGAFEDDSQKKRFIRLKNKPGEVYEVADGAISGKKIAPYPREATPTDLWESANRNRDFMDQMWAPPAMQGREGKSGESGRLFDSKREQGLMSMVPMSETLVRIDQEIGEAYLALATQVYAKIPRRYRIPGKNQEIKLNFPTRFGIEGDVSKIRRHNVTIVQSPYSESVRRERLSLWMSLSNMVRTPLVSGILELFFIDTIPGIPEEQANQMKSLAAKYLQLLVARNDAELAQLMPMLSGAAPQAPTAPFEPGKTPAEGGGYSLEGKAIPTQGGLPIDTRAQNQLM